MVLAAPAASADDDRRQGNRYDRHDNDRYRRYDDDRYRRHDRRFTLGVKIVDHDADDRGRRGVSRGDRWSLEFNLLDYRQRVGDGAPPTAG